MDMLKFREENTEKERAKKAPVIEKKNAGPSHFSKFI
jgi:hypothetical protein